MKKYLTSFAFIAVFALTSILIDNKFKENKLINDLLLINIECLATPENDNVRSNGFGSVDCPINNIKVIYYEH